MNNFNDLFLEAFNYYNEGVFGLVILKLNEAEVTFSVSEENSFSLEDLYILRGTTYFSNKEYDRAKIDFEKALQENPNSSEACLGLGRFFSVTGQLENAKTMFEWAVKYNKDHTGAREALENINSDLGFLPEHNTLAVENNYSEPLQKLGPLDDAAQLFSEKKYEEAVTKLMDAKKEQEEILGSIENFIAFNYLELDNIEGAKNAAERALRLNPFSSQAFATLGEISFRAKNYPAAKKMYEIALEHNSENDFAKNGMQNTISAMELSGGNGKADNHSFAHR